MTMLTMAELRTLTVNQYEPAPPTLELHTVTRHAVRRAARYLGIAAPALAYFQATGSRDCFGWTASHGRIWLWAGLAVSDAAHVAGHEVVHAWQLATHGSAPSMAERDYREAQADRLAMAICPGCSRHADPAAHQREQAAIGRAIGRAALPGGYQIMGQPSIGWRVRTFSYLRVSPVEMGFCQ